MSVAYQNLYSDGGYDASNVDLSDFENTNDANGKPVPLQDVYLKPEDWVLGKNRPVESLQT